MSRKKEDFNITKFNPGATKIILRSSTIMYRKKEEEKGKLQINITFSHNALPSNRFFAQKKMIHKLTSLNVNDRKGKKKYYDFGTSLPIF